MADDEGRRACDAEGFGEGAIAFDDRLPFRSCHVLIESMHVYAGLLRDMEEVLFGEIVFRRQQGLMKSPVFALQI